jgi:hypothetical protein
MRAIVLDCGVLHELPIIDIVLINLSASVLVSISAYSIINDDSDVKLRYNDRPSSGLR